MQKKAPRPAATKTMKPFKMPRRPDRIVAGAWRCATSLVTVESLGDGRAMVCVAGVRPSDVETEDGLRNAIVQLRERMARNPVLKPIARNLARLEDARRKPRLLVVVGCHLPGPEPEGQARLRVADLLSGLAAAAERAWTRGGR
jgi:hypothetical protein